MSEGRLGFWHTSSGYMDAYGVSKATATARDLGYVLIDGHEVPAVQKYYSTVGSGVVKNICVSIVTGIDIQHIPP